MKTTTLLILVSLILTACGSSNPAANVPLTSASHPQTSAAPTPAALPPIFKTVCGINFSIVNNAIVYTNGIAGMNLVVPGTYTEGGPTTYDNTPGGMVLDYCSYTVSGLNVFQVPNP